MNEITLYSQIDGNEKGRFFTADRVGKMNNDKKAGFGQEMASKWFLNVPKRLRFSIIFGALIVLIYLVNKG
ncbi:hypothetical protein J18TS1_04780 [Oceanobacillus oncorhynchi subsp. incaldanensis]|uniref:Uncharacterized protein n=1 Tax=Oceanobacillus aidingensis TaxID=645964 RepID=A0ABV9K177_9BACI|nr:hypothetical protein [Oceanobacillus oncorhynchi]MDM8101920.1 hypothetical protein [Oceanobacillus oncorhynchi]UUI42055.1 hypothetical protein NP440_11245 [Oceanobacillus oncorhynchi]GIO17378.1 hypothetical protein J18TS1_04780 [Oceanobacillus oncorhynchi subsp. incaldanensis]